MGGRELTPPPRAQQASRRAAHQQAVLTGLLLTALVVAYQKDERATCARVTAGVAVGAMAAQYGVRRLYGIGNYAPVGRVLNDALWLALFAAACAYYARQTEGTCSSDLLVPAVVMLVLGGLLHALLLHFAARQLAATFLLGAVAYTWPPHGGGER